MQACRLAETSLSRYQPIISIDSMRAFKIGQGATERRRLKRMVQIHDKNRFFEASVSQNYIGKQLMSENRVGARVGVTFRQEPTLFTRLGV